LLSHLKGIVDFDSEIADGAFELAMSGVVELREEDLAGRLWP